MLVRNPVSHLVATMASSMLTSFVGSTMAFTVAKVSGKGTVSPAEAHMRLCSLVHMLAGPCFCTSGGRVEGYARYPVLICLRGRPRGP